MRANVAGSSTVTRGGTAVEKRPVCGYFDLGKSTSPIRKKRLLVRGRKKRLRRQGDQKVCYEIPFRDPVVAHLRLAGREKTIADCKEEKKEGRWRWTLRERTGTALGAQKGEKNNASEMAPFIRRLYQDLARERKLSAAMAWKSAEKAESGGGMTREGGSCFFFPTGESKGIRVSTLGRIGHH